MNKFTILLLTLSMALAQNALAQQKKKTKSSGSSKKTEAVGLKTPKSNTKGKHQAWDAGIMAGTMFYYGETHCTPMWYKQIRPGGGLYARYSFSDKIAIRGNFETGQITGDDGLYEEAWRKARNFSFSNNLYAGALLLEWEPFGGWRYGRFNKFHRMLSPYVNIGAGYAYGKPQTDYSIPNTVADPAQILLDQNKNAKSFVFVPVGLGFRYDLNKSWTLGLEGGFRIPVTNGDYLDGISEAGNPEKRDWYETANLTIGYRFPFVRDADKDGIPDEEDPCPDAAGTRATKGCPDADGDGVADKLDACPELAGLAKFAGCPDSDSDGIPDNTDKCPTEKGVDFLGGCPDSDEDGIADKDDKCPTEKGVAEEEGCPLKDTDKDGTVDKEDKCPEVAGPQSNMGCPVDSTAAKADSTLIMPLIGDAKTNIENGSSAIAPGQTTLPANEKTNSKGGKAKTNTKSNASQSSTVTTSSNDLSQLPVSEVVVLDNQHSSTTTKHYTNSGKKSSSKSTSKKKSSKSSGKSSAKKSVKKSYSANNSYTGDVALAPTPGEAMVYKGEVLSSITREDEQLLKEAVKSIQFETGKAVLKSSSYETLLKIATLMQKYPTYKLRITGHTDNQGGSDLDNVKLSVARARAVYNYMLRKGIGYEQLTYRGCGDGNPVDSNDTEDGRYKNRRVEFDMLNR